MAEATAGDTTTPPAAATVTDGFDVDAWRQFATAAGSSPDDVLKKLEHARTWEKRAKDNATAAERLAEIEEANKSELEKATGRAETAEARAATVETELARMRVAIAKGLPADLVDRLRGDTPEELEADADKLLELVTPPPPGVPQASIRQGTPAGPALNDDDPLLRDLKSKLGIPG